MTPSREQKIPLRDRTNVDYFAPQKLVLSAEKSTKKRMRPFDGTVRIQVVLLQDGL